MRTTSTESPHGTRLSRIRRDSGHERFAHAEREPERALQGPGRDAVELRVDRRQPRRRAPAHVDRLRQVARQEQVVGVLEQAPEDAEVGRRAVLDLVDEEVGVAPAQVPVLQQVEEVDPSLEEGPDPLALRQRAERGEHLPQDLPRLPPTLDDGSAWAIGVEVGVAVVGALPIDDPVEFVAHEPDVEDVVGDLRRRDPEFGEPLADLLDGLGDQRSDGLLVRPLLAVAGDGVGPLHLVDPADPRREHVEVHDREVGVERAAVPRADEVVLVRGRSPPRLREVDPLAVEELAHPGLEHLPDELPG